MYRSLSVIESTSQHYMTLPSAWLKANNIKKKDLLMVFSPNPYESPLIVCTQKEYMNNPELRKIVDKIRMKIEKYEGTI